MSRRARRALGRSPSPVRALVSLSVASLFAVTALAEPPPGNVLVVIDDDVGVDMIPSYGVGAGGLGGLTPEPEAAFDQLVWALDQLLATGPQG